MNLHRHIYVCGYLSIHKKPPQRRLRHRRTMTDTDYTSEVKQAKQRAENAALSKTQAAYQYSTTIEGELATDHGDGTHYPVTLTVSIEPKEFRGLGTPVVNVEGTAHIDGTDVPVSANLTKSLSRNHRVLNTTVHTHQDSIHDDAPSIEDVLGYSHYAQYTDDTKERLNQPLYEAFQRIEDAHEAARDHFTIHNVEIDRVWENGSGETHAEHAEGTAEITAHDTTQTVDVRWRNAVDIGHQVWVGDEDYHDQLDPVVLAELRNQIKQYSPLTPEFRLSDETKDTNGAPRRPRSEGGYQ